MVKFLLILLFPFSVMAQTKFEFVKKEGGFKHPECVCVVSEDAIFIADIGKEMKPLEADSDGVLYKCSLKNISEPMRAWRAAGPRQRARAGPIPWTVPWGGLRRRARRHGGSRRRG